MSTVAHPRGPLPPRVYWTRRALVLVLAFALVFGIARLLGGGGGGAGEPTAAPVGSTTTSGPTRAAPTAAAVTPKASSAAREPRTTMTTDPGATGAPTAGPTAASPSGQATAKGSKSSSSPLPEPQGSCRPQDVVAVPTLKGQARGASAVVFRVTLTTQTSPACTFVVGAARLALKVTSGVDRIWSTQDCPGSVPKQQVVVRRDTPAEVFVGWNARRSDLGCGTASSYAQPGYYHVESVVIGSSIPHDEQFRLLGPAVLTKTATPTPTPKSQQKPKQQKSQQKKSQSGTAG